MDVQDRVFSHLTNSDILILETLTVGPATFYNQPARLEKVKTVMPFTATLGCDFLVRNYCLLDFGGRFIFFRSSKPSAEQTEALDKSLRNSGFREVILPKGWPLRLDAEINGSPVLLALHTGTVLSILDESQIKYLHLPIIQADTDALIRTDATALLVTSQGKTGQLRMVTASRFSVGNEQWSNVHFGSAQHEPDPVCALTQADSGHSRTGFSHQPCSGLGFFDEKTLAVCRAQED